ncbi:MAG: hypothetical protein IJV25_05765 [Prevotella sp.]|nr:hypothetical protein [Prevotella sp.]
MKRTIGILTVGVLLLLTGCGGDGYTPALRAIDSVINEKPDYPKAEILGHRDLPWVRKACPSFDAKTEYAHLAPLA